MISAGGNLKAEIPMMCFKSISPLIVLYTGAAGFIWRMVFSVSTSSAWSAISDLLSKMTSAPAICLDIQDELKLYLIIPEEKIDAPYAFSDF